MHDKPACFRYEHAYDSNWLTVESIQSHMQISFDIQVYEAYRHLVIVIWHTYRVPYQELLDFNI